MEDAGIQSRRKSGTEVGHCWLIDIVAKAISGIDIGFSSQKRKGIWMEVLRFIAEITAAPGPLRGGPSFPELRIV